MLFHSRIPVRVSMHNVRLLASCAIAALAAGAIASCSDNSPSAPTPSHQQTYRGVFVGVFKAGALSLTLTPRVSFGDRLLTPIARGAKGTITGALSFDGVTSYSVSGAYDTSNDTITFTADGATFYGTLDGDVFPARLVGRMLGTHAGILHCVPDDGTVVVHCGRWSWSPETGSFSLLGFLTRGSEVAGGVLTNFAMYPYYGYEIEGTLDGSGPVRPLTASGENSAETFLLSGYVDTAIDTAGGTWDDIPPSSTTRSGWWHTAAISPYGVEVARRSVP
jgi:hypothetical protein